VVCFLIGIWYVFQLLHTAKGTLIAIFSETGDVAGAETIAAVEASGRKPSNLFVASSRIDVLTAFHHCHPEYRTMWMIAPDQYTDYQIYTKAAYAGVTFVSIPAGYSYYSFAQGLRDRGFKVFTHNVNSAEAFGKAYELRADGISTLYPSRVKTWSKQ